MEQGLVSVGNNGRSSQKTFKDQELLVDDGSMHAPNTTPAKWDVHNGALLERRSPESTLEFKILSVTKDKLVIQDLAHGRKTQTWIRGEH